MKAGALGCKTMCKGRVNGAEIARFEEYKEGVLSLHTLRQHINCGYVVAHTIYDYIGVKVWIALPENYAELMDKRPDEGLFNKHTFNKDSSNKRVFFKKKKTKLTKRKENKICYNQKEQNGEEVILLDQKDKQVEEIQ